MISDDGICIGTSVETSTLFVTTCLSTRPRTCQFVAIRLASGPKNAISRKLRRYEKGNDVTLETGIEVLFQHWSVSLGASYEPPVLGLNPL